MTNGQPERLPSEAHVAEVGEEPIQASQRPRSDLFEVSDSLPFPILVTDRSSTVIGANAAAREFLGDLLSREADGTRTCCELFGCGQADGPVPSGCLTGLARGAGEGLPEVRVDLPEGSPTGAAWVTAAPVRGDRSLVVFQLRPGDPRDRRRRTKPHWIRGPQVRISALGCTRVEAPEGPIGGDWLDHRPGQILKYLTCERHRIVHAEAIWPNSGPKVLGNVRYFVHVLREKLEPGRPKGAPSSFIVAGKGGYAIDRDHVSVDADDFVRETEAGLAAFAGGEAASAAEHLDRGLRLYEGDFLSDELYATWAFVERDRLRDLASEALRTLAEIRLGEGDRQAAARHLERLAQMHPLDNDVQRRLLALWVNSGQRTQAARRYSALRALIRREFGEDLDFQLSDLRESDGSPPPG